MWRLDLLGSHARPCAQRVGVDPCLRIIGGAEVDVWVVWRSSMLWHAFGWPSLSSLKKLAWVVEGRPGETLVETQPCPSFP